MCGIEDHVLLRKRLVSGAIYLTCIVLFGCDAQDVESEYLKQAPAGSNRGTFPESDTETTGNADSEATGEVPATAVPLVPQKIYGFIPFSFPHDKSATAHGVLSNELPYIVAGGYTALSYDLESFDERAEEAAEVTAEMPVGNRLGVNASSDFYKKIFENQEDRAGVPPGSGVSHPYPFVTFDHGIAFAQQKIGQFAQRFVDEEKGQLDTFLATWEFPMMFEAYHFRSNHHTRCPSCDGMNLDDDQKHYCKFWADNNWKCEYSHCDALLADTQRFQNFLISHQDQLAPYIETPQEWFDQICLYKSKDPEQPLAYRDAVKHWDKFIHDHLSEVFHQAVYLPFAEVLPQIQMGDYQSRTHSPPHLYPVPRTNGGWWPEYEDGGLGGTHQGVNGYGSINEDSSFWTNDEVFANSRHFHNGSPFAALQYFSMNVRGAVLTGPDVVVWVVNKNWHMAEWRNTTYWEEAIFQYVLSGANRVFYWMGYNPFAQDGCENTEECVSDFNSAFAELNEAIGYDAHKEPLYFNVLPNGAAALGEHWDDLWQDRYLLSGMKLTGRVADDQKPTTRKVWRFVPELRRGETVDDLFVTSEQGRVILKARSYSFEKEIVFEDAEVFFPEQVASTKGLWVIQQAEGPPPYFNNNITSVNQCNDGYDNDEDGHCDNEGHCLDAWTVVGPDPQCQDPGFSVEVGDHTCLDLDDGEDYLTPSRVDILKNGVPLSSGEPDECYCSPMMADGPNVVEKFCEGEVTFTRGRLKTGIGKKYFDCDLLQLLNPGCGWNDENQGYCAPVDQCESDETHK